MILPVHIVIALSSVIYTAFVFFRPSKNKLKVSYTLTGLTLATGTYLVWSTGTHILQSCITGLLYIAIMLFGILATHYKLVHQKI